MFSKFCLFPKSYFGLGADWLRFDFVIFAFGDSQELLQVALRKRETELNQQTTFQQFTGVCVCV